MKSFLLTFFMVSIFYISIIYSQDVTATLGGNTSTNGFSVVNAAGDTVFRVTGEGNVGINTTTPTSIFDVQGGSTSSADGRDINLISESATSFGGDINLNGGSAAIDFGNGRGGNVSIKGGISNNGMGTGGAVNISSGTGAMTGGISIRTGNSGSYNTGTGSITIATASNTSQNGFAGGIDISTGNSPASTTNNITLRTGTNSAQGGNINLNATGLVIVNGSGTYSGTWTQASDQRFKKEVEPIKDAINKITQLNGISYEFNTSDFPEKNFANGRQIGLIAQEVEKIFPELVKTDPEGYKSVAYQNLVAVLIEAVKEQQKSIDQLKNEIELLKSSTDDNNIEVSSLEN